MMMNFRNYQNMTECIIPNKVTLSNNNMSYAFNNMRNLIYTEIPEEKVNNVTSMYQNCVNLITPVCFNNTNYMTTTYNNCTNLTTAVCGPNVTQMSNTYMNCKSLTTAVCGPNVTHMLNTYRNCPNIQGNVYFYSNSIYNAIGCFASRNKSNALNMYVHQNSITLNTLLCSNYGSVLYAPLTWTNDIATNGCYCNTANNLYIYPVANVEEARIANGD